MIHTLSTLPSRGGFVLGSSCVVTDLNRKRSRMKLGFVFSISHSTSFGVFQCSTSSGGGGYYGSSNVVVFSGHPNPKFDLRCGFLLGYPGLKYDYTLLKPNKSHVGDLALPPLGWALEEEENTNSTDHTSVNGESEGINPLNSDPVRDGYYCEQEMCGDDNSEHEEAVGDELVEEKTNSTDHTSVNGESEGINSLNSDPVRDGYYCEQEMRGDDNGKGEEDDDKEEYYNGRVDVRELANSLQTAKTVEDVEEILKDKGDLPLQVYSTIISWFGKQKRMDSALILFDWMKKRNVETNGSFAMNIFIYNSLLGVVKQCEQFEQMEEILSEMARDGMAYNVVTYNTLMAIYIAKGEGKKALGMLEEIHRNGLTPSPVSYSQAMLAYRRMEDGNGALNFFVEFREKYRAGEVGKDDDGEDWEKEFRSLERFTIRVCYQIMRRWLVSSENLSSNVLRFLVSMDSAGISLSQADLERLVWTCTREDHYRVVKELYLRIRERYDKISLSVCNHVIWLMGKAKKWWAALEIYEDLLEKGPKPNNLSYELVMSHFRFLLSAAKKKGIWKWGVRLLNKMEEKGLKPGSNEWNAVLVACSKASETAAAVQIFRRMVENGEKPTIISYGALLSALEKGKLYDEAFRVWNHMLKVGVEPNAYTYTIMASIYTAQGNFSRVDAIIREMVTIGVEVTVVTYNAIISGSARNGFSSAAYEWFHRMKVQNISPNETTYEMLIEALANDGKPRLAYELYLRAQNGGLFLSSKAYDAILQSSLAYGATIDVSGLGPRPEDKMKKVQIGKKH